MCLNQYQSSEDDMTISVCVHCGRNQGEVGVCDGSLHSINIPKRSEWRCELFGGGSHSITYTPRKGHEPNRFWRWMQFLCFGNRWVRTEK